MRTNVTDVKNILDNTTLSDPIITGYIDSANVFVTEYLEPTTLSAIMLEEIEKWLSAHLISFTRERMAASEEAGGAKIKYIGVFGKGLDSTPYGQTAIMLDDTGTLLELSAGKKNINITSL